MNKKLRIRIAKAKCIHNVAIRTGFHGEVKHVVIFRDESTKETWEWTTTDAGMCYEPPLTYTIEANYEEHTHKLSHVRDVGYKMDCDHDHETCSPKSELPDAVDILLGTASYDTKDKLCYMLDKRLNILYNNEENLKGGE